MQAVLFDLDGTLLDIDLETFLGRYFRGLGDAAARDASGGVAASGVCRRVPRAPVVTASRF